MSLRSLWSYKAMARRHGETLRRLRAAAHESHDDDAIEHINVKVTFNGIGDLTEFGASAPLCSPAFAANQVRSVRPYIASSPRTCNACLDKIRYCRLGHVSP